MAPRKDIGAPSRIERRLLKGMVVKASAQQTERTLSGYPEHQHRAKESANRVIKPLVRKNPDWNAPVISKEFKRKHLTAMQNEDDILPVIKRAQSVANKRGISKSTVIGATKDQRHQFEENLRASKTQSSLKKRQPTSIPLQGTSVTIERVSPHAARTHIKWGEQKLKGEARGKDSTVLSHFGGI